MDAVGDRIALTEAEMTMARQLIDNLARPFEPEKYYDELREQMASLIEGKVTGETFIVEAPTKGRKVVDLMEALRASIALTEKEKGQLEAKTATRTAAKKEVKTAARTTVKTTDKAEVKTNNDTDPELNQPSEAKPKSSLTPRKWTTRRAKGA